MTVMMTNNNGGAWSIAHTRRLTINLVARNRNIVTLLGVIFHPHRQNSNFFSEISMSRNARRGQPLLILKQMGMSKISVFSAFFRIK